MASIIKVDTIQTAAGGTPTAADLGINTTGNVLQVVHSQTTTSLDTTTSTYTDLGLSVSITPKSSSSKFLIIWHIQAELKLGEFSGYGTKLLYDAGSGYSTAYESNNTYDIFTNMTGTSFRLRAPWQYLHSPSTSSQITYKVQVATYSTSQVDFNNGGNDSFISVMEIAG